ncbi:hypothetical protein D8B26_000063 [Coccidioides posadasii str. Silveira]|uniref:FAD-dependent oxygenase n=2 Tax=Coccidioides posadasii TaxID=199306 RepID=E9D7G8_COCPS|nr:FAD-dependent oxygenase [Coccidioides posadasii str. Silveira]KMM71030.1 hypothetical protein CPAG_07337 [Coccidioides posadasii RMSCC 3488]QVM05352.1 hypothetical protein D8B26_000063 [Coccidioides posadasii str. Silveira]
MHWLPIKVASALALWATSSAARVVHELVDRSPVDGSCPQGLGWVDDVEKDLVKKLSGAAHIYLPGSGEFEAASTRWSVLETPRVNVVVVPGTANDVAETVKFANKKRVPFLAYNTAHGALTTLGRMDCGIEIFMKQLSGVKIAKNGQTAKIGGGTLSKLVTDTLWAAGKQTVTGACECVSYLGPALGGGHGWLQGHHGLIADQLVSMDVVLANGSLRTINPKSDLWWGMKGAGQNFGIVTSATAKIFDIEHRDWAIETLTFRGDKVEAIYQATNEHLLREGKRRADVTNWSYWLNIPTVDPNKPVIVFYIIQEGVKAVDPEITEPFRKLGPLAIERLVGTYRDLARWTGIAITSPPCQKAGLANPRFPIYLESYNVAAQKKAYELFASEAHSGTPFFNSIFMFEGYSVRKVQSIDSSSSAFAYRGDSILAAPLLSYERVGAERDEKAATLGTRLREIIHEGTGRNELHAYVNYAFGDETPQQWFGAQEWRQSRLRKLKQKYDPQGKFSFYGPIA